MKAVDITLSCRDVPNIIGLLRKLSAAAPKAKILISCNTQREVNELFVLNARVSGSNSGLPTSHGCSLSWCRRRRCSWTMLGHTLGWIWYLVTGTACCYVCAAVFIVFCVVVGSLEPSP